MNKLKWAFFILLVGILAFSCKKTELITDSNAKLSFSADTIIFDTIFTTIGSTTEALRIYNTHDQPINISNLRLAGGNSSFYRINVDGEPGIEFENIEIPAEDSLWVFVEVTLDPNNLDNPLIVTDSILFETNGNLQDVDLVAWGQDANFFYPTNSISGFPDFTCLDGDCFNQNPCVEITWDDPKPYVIYGYLVVDSCDILNISPGTQIHFHANSGLWVYSYGEIKAIGSADEPIVFQGDRLESIYDEIPGQWDRIWINEGESGTQNVFRHCEIKNNFIGIQAEPLVLNEADVTGPSAENQLIIENTIIKNNSAAGLLIRNYNISSTNSLFANAGQYCSAITGGGEYQFLHCTFGNYWQFSTRTTPAFFIGNIYEDVLGNVQVRDISNSFVHNSIIYGNSFDELIYNFDDDGMSDIVFDGLAVKVDETNVNDNNFFVQAGLRINQNPDFVEPSDGDFHILESSPCKDFYNSPNSPFIINDLELNLRTLPADLGCYEYQE